MDSPSRSRSRWDSPWGRFFFRAAVFLRVVALLCGVTMGGLVLAYLLRSGWASFLLPACIEAGVILAFGFLLQLVPFARNRAVRP
ncbi:hypothetical protein [Lacisediminihabitans changchengi]|uniref:Uncharacterized protein n=1 Tax=Lacisediminihabitans changchengi TaxID=2787634 RepID=A0A934SKL6_9MICO|nr:hypothetical protein [Lacisediminihabitans changchengi]MBK4347094.1 hypothetical protein [Lacisediminihabitans changchengi]MBK4347783.1 hypothetical protein [Lacisediminihabitans changchengi]